MTHPSRQGFRNGALYHVVIADDHDLARAGLRAVFDDTRDLYVVGEARDGYEAVQLCAQYQPQLAVVDVRMPGLDGLQATRAIKTVSPRTAVLILSFHVTTQYVIEAVRIGAAGYLIKDTPRDLILQTSRQVLNGESPLLGAHAAELLLRASEGEAQTAPITQALTNRERQVLRCITEGHTNREIAVRLEISAGTVKNHVEHIIAKLGVSDRTQAAVYALRSGLLAEQPIV